MSFVYTKRLLDRFFEDSNITPGLYRISSNGRRLADYRYAKVASNSTLIIVPYENSSVEKIVLGVLSGIYDVSRCAEYVYSIIPSTEYPGFCVKKTLRDDITDKERNTLMEQHNYFENVDISDKALIKAFSEHISNNIMNLLSTFVVTPSKKND